MRCARWLILVVSLAAVLAPQAQAGGNAPPPDLNANLIKNPGGDATPGAIDRSSVVCPQDWSCRTSQSTIVQYGTAGFPSQAESQRIGGGQNFFAGGPQSGGLLGTIGIDVSGAAGNIDAGLEQVTLSACLGGLGNGSDYANLHAHFYNDASASLGDTQVLSTPDRHGETKFLPVSTTRPVPANTRTMDVLLDLFDADGGYTDAYADNVSLRLTPTGTTPPAPSCGTAGGGSGGGTGGGSGGGGTSAFGAKTLVTLKLAGGQIPANGPVAIKVANDNGFTITGNLGGRTTSKVSVSKRKRVKLKTKSFSVSAHTKRTVKLKLPKALRRLLKRKHKLSLRLSAVVKDPAGHSRTVSKTIKPKLKRKRRG
jgi:hypothetical protein